MVIVKSIKTLGKYLWYVFGFMVDPDRVIASEVDDSNSDVKKYKADNEAAAAKTERRP